MSYDPAPEPRRPTRSVLARELLRLDGRHRRILGASDVLIAVGDLPTAPAPDDHFDLVVTDMALHHVPDEEAVLSRFADLLVDGGHVCIVDLEKEDGSFHGADFDGHHGFDRAHLATELERAGFADVTFQH